MNASMKAILKRMEDSPAFPGCLISTKDMEEGIHTNRKVLDAEARLYVHVDDLPGFDEEVFNPALAEYVETIIWEFQRVLVQRLSATQVGNNQNADKNQVSGEESKPATAQGA